VTPRLYELITLTLEEESLANWTHRYGGLPLEQVEKYTKEIWIRVHFHKRLRKRCWHHSAEIMRDASYEEDPFFDAMVDLDMLLSRLRTNNLRSFR
jgi:hypothetical protein